MNEARVVDFGGMERKEDVNRVSKLSKSTRLPICCGPCQTKRVVEATGNKRRQAHSQVLRKIRTDIEGLRNHEKVNGKERKAVRAKVVELNLSCRSSPTRRHW